MTTQETSSLHLDSHNLSSSSVNESLNLTSINGVTTNSLQELFDKDPEKFFKYASVKKRRYLSIIEEFDAEKCEGGQIELKKDEALLIADTLATYLRFIDIVAGLCDDTINDRLINLESELRAVHGLYVIKTETLKEKVLNLTSGKVAKAQAEDVPSDKDSKKEDLEDQARILFSSETPNFLRSRSMAQQLQGFDETGKEATQVIQHSSTPMRSNHVRFSDVISQHTVSDHQSIDTQDNSWKLVIPTTNHIEEISLVEDLQAISVILEKKVHNKLSDVEIVSMEKRDCKELKLLKTNIERKSTNLPIICNNDLKGEAVKAFKAATEWIRSVENLIQARQLHLESDHKNVKPLDVPAFKGHMDNSTNIYEFLSNFSIVSRGFTDQDRASYLYHNFLSESIQSEVRHVRTNFIAMRKILLDKHGNCNVLVLHKRNQIKQLKQTSIKSTKEEKIKYIKSFCEILDQLASLVEINTSDFPNMSNEIFSYSNVMAISKLLPDYLFRLFSNKYIKECTKKEVQALSGLQSFDVLVEILKHHLRELEFTAEVFLSDTIEKDKSDVKPSKVKSVMNLETEDEKDNNTQEKRKPFSADKYHGAPCIAHQDLKLKVKYCFSGKCSAFLNMSPEKRVEQAELKKVCKTCLLFICLKKQTDNECLFLKVLPKGILCNACKNQGMITNVLLCTSHKNDYEELASDLAEFLPAYRKGTKISLFFLGNVNKIERALQSKPVRENLEAFDVETGKTIPKADITFKTKEDDGGLAIYPTQHLNLNGVKVCVLWDTGALGELVKRDIAEKLNLTILDERSQSFTVAGGQVVNTKCPMYQLTLGPSDRDEYFTFPLLGVEKISHPLPEIDLEEIVTKVRKRLVSFNESKETFPEKVGGGEIDLIIGSRQSHIFPCRIYCLEDGLQIWRSPLKDCYGSNIIFSGPIEKVKNAMNLIQEPTFFQQFQKTPMIADVITPLDDINMSDITEEVYEHEDSNPNETCIMNFISNMCFNNVDIMKKNTCPRALEKEFEDQELAGCTVDYRCESCAPCVACKQSDKLRKISIREAAEEALIEKSVTVDTEKGVSTCSYPFTTNPETYLKKMWKGKNDNYEMALSVFETQRRKSAEIRKSVVKFNQELYERGYVAPVDELPVEVQNLINNADFRHYFCWRSVHKPDSVSTPSRLVVDPTMSSFNNIIAKGQNCLTSLFQIVINWRCNKFGFTSDISKMFNSVRLTQDMYRFSLYLFSDSLDPVEDIRLYCFTTLMYGICSSSNQATCALRRTAEIKKDELPLANKVIQRFTYMDDSSDAAKTRELMDKIIEELVKLLPYGGFKLKVVTKSGEDPPEAASSDGVSVLFAGYKWKSKADKMMFKSQEINFNVRSRGLKKPNVRPIITNEDIEDLMKGIILTRRKAMGKVMENFDIVGILEPLKVRYKIDLHTLSGSDYDVPMSDSQRIKWIENLKIMNQSRDIEIPRSVVHIDAVDTDELELICCSDAAVSMAGCCIYVRTRLPDNSFSVRLLTARSKTVWGSIPRNELISCLLMAETAFTVCKVLGDRVKKIMFLTDSSISLCWISNDSLKLKQFVHSRVRQIIRLVDKHDFYHIAGENNPADLLTRGMVTVEDVDDNSTWQCGADWMFKEVDAMPIRNYDQVCADLTPEAVTDVEKEAHPSIPVVAHIEDYNIDVFDCLCINEFNDDHDGSCIDLLEGTQTGIPAIASVCPNLCKDQARVAVNAIKNLTKTSPEVEERYILNFVRIGFKKAFMIMSYIMRFVSKLKHKRHLSGNIDFSEECPICKVESRIGGREFGKLSASIQTTHSKVYCSPLDCYLAWMWICKVGTQEFKDHHQDNPNKLKNFEEHNNILYGAGRLDLPDIRVETDPPIFDLGFKQPVFLNTSALTYSLVMYIHWEDPSYCHAGVERTLNYILKMIHVPNIRKIVKYIRETCLRCRYLLKRHYLPLSCNQSAYSLLRAPPFFCTMCDIAGNFTAYDSVKRRVSRPAYFLVAVCMTTGATSIGVLEDLSSSSVILALSRTAYRYGWPKYVLLDNAASLKALQDARVCFSDLAGKLWTNQKLILDFSTPYSHQEHGRAESKVKVLKDFLEKGSELCKKHSYLELESIALNVSSIINGLPICTNSDDTANTVGELNLITPNLFLLGRNSSRSPERFVTIETNPGKALKELASTSQELMNLLSNYVHRFIPGKRYSDVRPPEVGDIVLFLHREAQRTRNQRYKYGRVISINVDGRINKTLVEYRNADEVKMRQVERNIKHLVLILGCEEVEFNTLEHYLAIDVQRKHL